MIYIYIYIYIYICLNKILEKNIMSRLKIKMQLETEPSKYLPEVSADKLSDNVVKIDINKPMKEILSTLTKHPIKTRLSLTGVHSVSPRTLAIHIHKYINTYMRMYVCINT